MIVKIIFVFLLLLVALTMLGSAVTKYLRGPKPPPTLTATRAKCAHCGRSVTGTAPCSCGQG